MDLVLALIVLPVIGSLLLMVVTHIRMQYAIVSLVLFLSMVSTFLLHDAGTVISAHLSDSFHFFIIVMDIALLIYFLYQGKKFNNLKVMALAAFQLLLYGYIETIAPSSNSADIVVDSLSIFMFFIINAVGGIIVLFALKYMEEEPVSAFKKRLFISALLLFMSVMNVIVIANSILLFFFLFEMTTLASYLLIAFRDDIISRTNALRALWMNQVGGVVILLGALLALLSCETLMFDTLIEHTGGVMILAVAFLAMAALVKGASLPFEGWLLGAMVAPTPVSAMLHSATMVKIAPYLILKLAPALAMSLVGDMISIIGGLVFVVASYLALSRSMFKEILGYSTVALLGLMMAMAAIGTKESIALAMAIMLFHALSKALLFLSAGVLERTHHVKDIEDMKGMIMHSPQTVGFILFGFVSLTLPPFGLFFGKLLAISSLASSLHTHPIYLIVLLCVVIGSALMVLLYFKVASALVSATSDTKISESQSISAGFQIPLILLSVLIVLGAIGYVMMQGSSALMWLAVPIVLVLAIPLIIRLMDRYDRSVPYMCGEKEPFDSALIYFKISPKVEQWMYVLFIILFFAVAVIGVLS